MKRVFIVPYRDRPNDRATLLKRLIPYKIFFVHQRDERPFNRGAMKNIGFLVMKKLYPDEYQQMTFVFHDVDVYPKEGVELPYDTEAGTVAHYYGFRFALGGMFAIKGGDFERTNGFPSLWGWGLEDNVMQHRCLASGLLIDRSHFYPIGDPHIQHTFDGFKKRICRSDAERYFIDKSKDNGLHSLKQIDFTIEADMIHVDHFETGTQYKDSDFFTKDIRKGSEIVMPNPKRMSMRNVIDP